MKKVYKALAAVLCCGAACLAGCAGNPVSRKTATFANWNVRTSTSAEKELVEEWKTQKEVCEYALTLSGGANSSYSLEYRSASYKTEFYAVSYDWSLSHGGAAMPEGYAPKDKTVETAYVFKTETAIDGVYTLRNGEKRENEEKVTTVCYYRLAGENLQPLYSKQEIKNLAPIALTATSFEQCLKQLDEVHEVFYNANCTEATAFKTDNTAKEVQTESVKVSLSDKNGFSVFDNSQIRAAARAFTLSGGATYTFNLFAPQNKMMQTCTATCAAPVKLNKEDNEQKGIIDALKNSGGYVFFDDSAEDIDFRFSAVSFGVASSMPGSASTSWYAAIENADINASKAVMLKTTYPLPFGLGTANYVLKSLAVKQL